jgi:hypothetical protein
VFPEDALEKHDTLAISVDYGGMPLCQEGRGPVFGPVSYCLPQARYCDYFCLTSHWLPINNAQSDLATWDITYDVAEGLCVASIGLLADHATDQGRARYRWVESVPTPPQVVSWAIAEYSCVRDNFAGVPVEYYVRTEDKEKAAGYFAPIESMVAQLTDVLGAWPVEKIGFCWTPVDGMEGQGMIPIGIPSWDATAGAREAHMLAHHWFGNSLVPATMSDNWLSDGFATYMEWMYRAGQEADGDIDRIAGVANTQYVESIARNEGVFPLYDFRSHIIDNCPVTIHTKGASVLNMLRHVMGDADFAAGLRAYAESYRQSPVTSEIFRGVMQEHTQADLTQFFEQWVYGEGWPEMAFSRLSEDPDGPFRLCVRQEQVDYWWPLFTTPVEVEVLLCAGDTLRLLGNVHAAEQDILVFDEIMDKNVAAWRVDPDGWLLKDILFTSSVDGVPPRPSALTVHDVYPHPLRGSSAATLPLELRRAARVRVELRDLLGRSVAVLADANHSAGKHAIALSVPELPAGCYQLRVTAAGNALTRPLLVR